MIIVTLKKDDVIRDFRSEGGKILTTIEIAGEMVSNPTLEMMYADGWQSWMRPVPPPYIPTREEKINRDIRAVYSENDEMQLMREKLAGKEGADERFAVYNAYVEEVLARYPEEDEPVEEARDER